VATGLRGDVRWALAIGGAVGLICGGIMLTTALGQYGKSSGAASFMMRLPFWARWDGVPPAEPSMLIVGFLCALLLVAGRWPVKVCAALSAAWFLYAEIHFRSDGPAARHFAQTFDMTPFYHGALLTAGVLVVVSVLALITAALPKRRGGSLRKPSPI
jgi:hypothetical protein